MYNDDDDDHNNNKQNNNHYYYHIIHTYTYITNIYIYIYKCVGRSQRLGRYQRSWAPLTNRLAPYGKLWDTASLLRLAESSEAERLQGLLHPQRLPHARPGRESRQGPPSQNPGAGEGHRRQQTSFVTADEDAAGQRRVHVRQRAHRRQALGEDVPLPVVPVLALGPADRGHRRVRHPPLAEASGLRKGGFSKGGFSN